MVPQPLLPAARLRLYHALVDDPGNLTWERERRTSSWMVAVGLLMVVVVTLGHYMTPAADMSWHDTLRRLYYLPIAAIGVRCGLRAGLGLGVLVAVLYFPHIYTHWGGHPLGPTNLNRTFEVLLWIAVGSLTGFLSDRERRSASRAEQARRAAEQSAKDARQATRSLLEVQDQLRQADRLATLGTLSAGLAHEVRNPLGSLRGIADMLREKELPETTQMELVEILDKEVRRLDGVVTAFLESARPGQAEGPTLVAHEMEAVGKLLAFEVGRHHAVLEVDVPVEGLTIPLPGELLRQVLLNLVLNALQSGGPGGRVSLQGRESGERTEILVEDQGPGFPEEMAGADPRPFFTTRKHGTGLGLAISREIVESHGGRLSLENREQGGARVRLTFGGEQP